MGAQKKAFLMWNNMAKERQTLNKFNGVNSLFDNL
jgi:hypothetical protein